MNAEDADAPLLTIGQLAEQTGVSRRTVRYYVQRGLIDPPVGRGRGSGYTAQHAAQIQRVIRLQREGLPLENIAELPADAAPIPPVVVQPQLIMRLPLADGVRLELDAGASVPDAKTLDRLAEACRAILSGDAANEFNHRPFDDGHIDGEGTV